MMQAVIAYFSQHSSAFFTAVWQHIFISLVAVLVALLIGFPLGVLSARSCRIRKVVTGVLSSLRVVPSLALLFLIVTLTGTVGPTVAVFALTVLALPVILINTTVAFSQLPTAPVEAATALGMSSRKVFLTVKLPLAAPIIFAGIKTATTEVIASATLGAYIGSGGLGTIIFTGLGLMRTDLLVIGGVSVAVLSLGTIAVLNIAEHLLLPWKRLSS